MGGESPILTDGIRRDHTSVAREEEPRDRVDKPPTNGPSVASACLPRYAFLEGRAETRRRTKVAVVLLALAFALGNSLLPWLDSIVLFPDVPLWEMIEPYLRLALEFAIWTQILVGAIVLTLLGGPFWLRLCAYWASAVLLATCWGVNVFLADAGDGFIFGPDFIVVMAVALLPTALLASQCPLWICRLFLGWRIVHSDEYETVTERRLSVQDYLCTMAILGVSLGAIRLSFDGGSGQPSTDLAAMIGSIIAVPLIFSLVTGPPLVRIILGIERTSRRWIAWGVYACVVSMANVAITLGLLLTITMVQDTIGRLWIILAVGLNTVAFIFGPTVCLAGMRWFGFRLSTRRMRARLSRTAIAAPSSTPPTVAEPPGE